MKTDFLKAYDRVEHIFIWETMLAMGFDKKVVRLAQGLVEQVQSTVHINGKFMASIKLEQRVCQGCPMSTPLFVISTQPLMELIKEKVRTWDLSGVQIGEGQQLTHQVFADDTGLFF